MGVHVRKGRHFVQDGQWYASNECYQDFMEKACAGNALLLEPGVGYDTPTIIRFPFERWRLKWKTSHWHASTGIIPMHKAGWLIWFPLMKISVQF